eukprot:360046-Chlamydomonas_euryale.AAC.6
MERPARGCMSRRLVWSGPCLPARQKTALGDLSRRPSSSSPLDRGQSRDRDALVLLATQQLAYDLHAWQCGRRSA